MARPPKDTLVLKMPLEEALERFICVDLKDMAAQKAKAKRRAQYKARRAKQTKKTSTVSKARTKPAARKTKRRKKP